MTRLYANFLLVLFFLSASTQASASSPDPANMKLDDALQIVATVKSRPKADNALEFSKITTWVNTISAKVKTIAGRDLAGVSKPFSGQTFYALGKNTFSNKKNLMLDYEEHIVYLDNGFVLQTGNCELGHVNNSVVFCTGNLRISHSNNNILIANGEIDIAHDGNGPEQLGSIIYSRKKVEISHSNASVILFSPKINISHLNNTACINTGRLRASHGKCHNIQSSYFTEDSSARIIAGLEIKQPAAKKLDPDVRKVSKDPVVVAESFCQGIKQLNFDYSKKFLHASVLDKFNNNMTRTQRDLKNERKREKIMKHFNNWSCEHLHVENSPENQTTVTVGGLGNVKLRKENGGWKIIKF